MAHNFNQTFNNLNARSNISRDVGAAVSIVAGALIAMAAKGNVVVTTEGAAASGAAGFAVGAFADHLQCETYKVAAANQLKIATAALKAGQIGEQSANGQNSAVGTNITIQDNGQPSGFSSGHRDSVSCRKPTESQSSEIAQLSFSFRHLR